HTPPCYHSLHTFFYRLPPPPHPPLFPYTTLFRSSAPSACASPCRRVRFEATRGPARRSSAGRRHQPPGDHSIQSPAMIESNGPRSEEHTSELQSRSDLVCRLLLEKKKKKK